MKIVIIVFVFCYQICFSQKIINDSIRFGENFNSVIFTGEQRELIIDKFHLLKSLEISKDISLPKGYVNNKIRLYAYSILNSEQRNLYDNSWRDATLRLVQSYYHYLDLSNEQKKNILDTMLSKNGFDTLMIINEVVRLDRKAVNAVLDSTQLQIELAQQKANQLEYEKSMRWQDHLNANDTSFERQRLSLVSEYSIKYLQKAKNKALKKIKKVAPDDINEIDKITKTYHARVGSDLVQAIRGCYSKDSVLIFPNNKILAEYKFKRYDLLPTLCVYWCRFGKAQTAETNGEEEHIIATLEYLKLTYRHIVDNEITKLKKEKNKLNIKIDALRPPKKPGTIVTIDPGNRIKAVDDYAELFLAPGN